MSCPQEKSSGPWGLPACVSCSRWAPGALTLVRSGVGHGGNNGGGGGPKKMRVRRAECTTYTANEFIRPLRRRVSPPGVGPAHELLRHSWSREETLRAQQRAAINMPTSCALTNEPRALSARQAQARWRMHDDQARLRRRQALRRRGAAIHDLQEVPPLGVHRLCWECVALEFDKLYESKRQILMNDVRLVVQLRAFRSSFVGRWPAVALSHGKAVAARGSWNARCASTSSSSRLSRRVLSR